MINKFKELAQKPPSEDETSAVRRTSTAVEEENADLRKMILKLSRDVTEMKEEKINIGQLIEEPSSDSSSSSSDDDSIVETKPPPLQAKEFMILSSKYKKDGYES